MNDRATLRQSPADDFPAPKRRDERVLTVPQRIDEYLERISATDRKGAFSETMREIRELKAHYSLRYTRVALTKYRAAVADALGADHPALAYLHSFRKDLEAINSTQRAKVYAQHHELRPIDPDAFVDQASAQLTSSNYGNAVAGLLLLTGRRPVEICYTGDFSQIPGRDDVLMFAGQAKGKGVDKPPYEIPVLGDPAAILEAIEAVRAKRTFASEADVNAKVGKDIGDGSRRVFGDYKPKELRQIYATIAHFDYEESEPQPRISQPAFFAKILGHAAGDINTALSYLAFYVDGDFDRTVSSFRQAMPDMVRTLQERRSAPDATDRVKELIDRDIDKVRNLFGDVPVPVETSRDEVDIDRLSEPQHAMLRGVLAGKRSYQGSEWSTAEALERRGYLTIEYPGKKQTGPPTLTLTSRGAELAALSAQDHVPSATENGSLPVFGPAANSIVQMRENYRPEFKQRFTVIGQSSDGQRVFGQSGAAVLSISAQAFSEIPAAGDQMVIGGGKGRDVARFDPDPSSQRLPIFKPGPRDVVEMRENYRPEHEQRVVVFARSEDGKRIFGRNGASVLSIPATAFAEEPKSGTAVSIRAKHGQDVADTIARGIER